MSSRKNLLESLTAQLEIELAAKKDYEHYVKSINDTRVRAVFNTIIEDEKKHATIVQDMINLVTSYPKIQENDEIIQEKGINENPMADSDILLLVSDISLYVHKIIETMSELPDNSNIIYVSFNKHPTRMMNLINDHGMDPSKIQCVTCSKSTGNMGVFISPEDLTNINITLSGLTNDFENSIILFDTITSFSSYHNWDLIQRFVGASNDSARNGGYKIIWVAVPDDSNKDGLIKLSQICDKTIWEKNMV